MDRRRQLTPRAAVLPYTVRTVTSTRRNDGARPLVDAVHLSTAEGDYTLFAERVLIGRGAHCRIIVLDPLVSREHAVLQITGDAVTIEDLRSANGVYVNNVRIFEPQAVYDGDRILVGTHEMAAFAATAEQRPPSATLRSSSTQTGLSAPPSVATERSDAIAVLGRLADRMLEQGLPAEAERVLADHLHRVLAGARTGLPVPRDTCTSAAKYALLFAAELHDGGWVNFTLELHLRAQALLAPELLPGLGAAIAACRNVDGALFGYYRDWVRTAIPQSGLSAKRVLDALEAFHVG